MAAKIRVGIISANWGVTAHLPAWRAHPDVEVVAICTAHRETAEAAAKAHKIPLAFWDYRKMAQDPSLDVVDVGTRPNLRYDMCMTSLNAGKHVYTGVPFAASIEHARDLRDTQLESRRVGAIDAYSEYLPPFVLAKEMIEEGALGQLFSFTCVLQMSLFNAQQSTFPYNWFWDRAHGCSALRNLGSHALNLLYYFFGEVDAVIAQDEMCLKEWKFVEGSRAAQGAGRHQHDSRCTTPAVRDGGCICRHGQRDQKRRRCTSELLTGLPRTFGHRGRSHERAGTPLGAAARAGLRMFALAMAMVRIPPRIFSEPRSTGAAGFDASTTRSP